MAVRFIFHLVALAWLAVLGILDIYGNANSVDFWSDVYMVKSGLDVALIIWTGLFIRAEWKGKTDLDLGTSEYIYFGFMAVYALANLLGHHSINKSSTGFVAFLALLMVWVDVAISAFAGVNFWSVAKSKAAAVAQQVQTKLKSH